jgi:hypothetical protein
MQKIILPIFKGRLFEGGFDTGRGGWVSGVGGGYPYNEDNPPRALALSASVNGVVSS